MIAYLDTYCVIYFVEQNAAWWSKIIARLALLRRAGDEIGISDLTRTECLVGPFTTGDAGVLANYQAFFTDPAVHVFPLTAAVCERAARLRAAHRFRLADALHLAVAIEHGCGLFLTNDAHLNRCTDIPVEVLT